MIFMNNQEITDRKWMRMALDLAGNGEGRVHPNPLVGAVIVKEDTVIGKGWHAYCGGLHAERNALKDCRERGNDPEGATIYVTLEPCIMCAGLMHQARIVRCVYGAPDQKAGAVGTLYDIHADGRLNHQFEVTGGVREEECVALLRDFFRARRKKPMSNLG